MPKMKSHSGAKKRFKVTGTGKVQARHAFSSHILEKKSPKRKRHMHLDIKLVKGDARRAVRLLNGKRPMTRVKRSVHAARSAARSWSGPRASAARPTPRTSARRKR